MTLRSAFSAMTCQYDTYLDPSAGANHFPADFALGLFR